mmetsp:Transcript_30991/g.51816  ORF Transcript_30991/g.51816 Transcript_30991/m.51816 type:complete len:247 (-) Transcript_30991:60-800(-)
MALSNASACARASVTSTVRILADPFMTFPDFFRLGPPFPPPFRPRNFPCCSSASSIAGLPMPRPSPAVSAAMPVSIVGRDGSSDGGGGAANGHATLCTVKSFFAAAAAASSRARFSRRLFVLRLNSSTRCTFSFAALLRLLFVDPAESPLPLKLLRRPSSIFVRRELLLSAAPPVSAPFTVFVVSLRSFGNGASNVGDRSLRDPKGIPMEAAAAADKPGLPVLVPPTVSIEFIAAAAALVESMVGC